MNLMLALRSRMAPFLETAASACRASIARLSSSPVKVQSSIAGPSAFKFGPTMVAELSPHPGPEPILYKASPRGTHFLMRGDCSGYSCSSCGSCSCNCSCTCGSPPPPPISPGCSGFVSCSSPPPSPSCGSCGACGCGCGSCYACLTC
jgi:hypothetical protein